MSYSAYLNRRPFIVAGLVLSALTTAFAVSPVAAQDSKKDSAERILFVSNRDNEKQYAIYAMNPDGTGQTRITKGEGICFDPDWSPDHTRILFCRITNPTERTSSVCVMKPDGSEITTLLSSTDKTIYGGATWSPDGKRIALAATKPDPGMLTSTICVMDPDGKNLKKVVDGVVPLWAPDGKRLLFSPIPTSGAPKLQSVDIDGGNVKTILDKALAGSWSPDGKKLAYATDRDGRPVIATVNADGTNPSVLTKDANIMAIGPVWTGDGKHILYTRLPKDNPGGLKTEVWIMDADGGNAKAVTKSDSFIGAGTALIFLAKATAK